MRIEACDSGTMETCLVNGKRHQMKLELVQTLFRHGERTNEVAEVNIFNYFGPKAYEPFGIGQLTNNGKQEAFKVGQMLRQRYDDFLKDSYNPNVIYAISSEDDRTKMSLQLVLAGLYPPSPEFVWNSNLNWMPLPTRYTPKEADTLLKPHYNKRYYGLWEKLFTSPEFQKKLSKFSDFFDLMKEKTGVVDVGDDVVNTCYLFNSLYLPSKMNIPMPDWYTEDVKNTWREIYALILSSMAHSLELQRMNGGPVIKTLLDNMNVDGVTVSSRKIYLYSGHDHNLYAVKEVLKLSEPDFFETGTGYIFEKWRDTENQLYIRILVWTVPGEKPWSLRLSGKNEFCLLEDFLDMCSHVIPTEEEMQQMCNDITAEEWRKIFASDSHTKL